MAIMILKCSLLFLYFIQMIVAKNVHDEMSNDRIMIPYKSVYGAPRKCKLTSDHKTTEEKYRKCQINAIDKWKITLQHYYTESWDFCCFVYDVLKCETKVLSECDPDYSDRNDKETRLLFDKSCQPIIINNPCNKDEDGGNAALWIAIGIGIVSGISLMILSGYCLWKKQLSSKVNAKKAYKAEKFQELYEKEYVRAVYDHEVDILNNKSLQNASKQTTTDKNEETKSISKQQDEIKTKEKLEKELKNNLKKIEKKIKSEIDAKSKNDSSFWDEFNKDPEKYKQPTGVMTKTKNFLKKLWPKKEVKSEEQLKREELIRSEARRQYENIHNVDQSQSTKPEKLKSLIVTETEDTDSLLTKMLNILNQEQVDVHHEMIKITDFPKSGEMDQMEKWTKNFKDTRNRIRNEFDKKLEITLGKPTSEDQTGKIGTVSTKVENQQTTTSKLVDKMTQSTTKPEKSQTTKIEPIPRMKKEKWTIEDEMAFLASHHHEKYRQESSIEDCKKMIKKSSGKELERYQILLERHIDKKQKCEEIIANRKKAIISGDAFKMEKSKMTELEYANKILDELDKYDVQLNEKEKNLYEAIEKETNNPTLNIVDSEDFVRSTKYDKQNLKIKKELTKKLKEMMMKKKAEIEKKAIRTKREIIYDGKELNGDDENKKKNVLKKLLLKKKSSNKDQTSFGNNNGQDSITTNDDFSVDSDQLTTILWPKKKKSTNLFKQIDHPIEPNIQSSNIIDSLKKRIKKIINQTILSTTTTTTISDQQFSDYTRQF
ncbi:hypothetical protein DERP_002517 [Dermatophagoides pteronyssinus]|uniref:Uncharacterized protein n=1 Tax=Dermatophagoides pteronyssinus TaxID=6956 RepID=A0ABQ8JHY2_DERPT|nr:hypothetical protein DERP_002517 [Dermatophagoides pteronyssinus]